MALGGEMQHEIPFIYSPSECIRAHRIISSGRGWMSVSVEKRPSGSYLVLEKIPPKGPIVPFVSVQLDYQLSTHGTPTDNFHADSNEKGISVIAVARNSPKIRVHWIKHDGEHQEGDYRLPTIQKILGNQQPIALTRGGTLTELGLNGTGRMLPCPDGFPGQRCAVGNQGKQISIAWLPGEPQEGEMAGEAKPSVQACLQGEPPMRFHRKRFGQNVYMCSDKKGPWVVYMLTPSAMGSMGGMEMPGDFANLAMSSPELWAAQVDGAAHHPLSGPEAEDMEEIDCVLALSGTKAAYVVASTLDGTLVIYELTESKVRIINRVG
jgi:hypothetical protein